MLRIIYIHIFLIVIILSTGAGYAQVRINDIYKGSVYYIVNPLNSDSSCCCINEIYLNDRLFIANIQSPDLELDHTYFNKDEPFSLLIKHNENCIPKIHKHARKLATFIKYGFNEKSFEFYTKGDSNGDKFIVEVLLNNAWIELKQFDFDKKRRYKLLLKEIPKDILGLRIKYASYEGRTKYSKTFVYNQSGKLILKNKN